LAAPIIAPELMTATPLDVNQVGEGGSAQSSTLTLEKLNKMTPEQKLAAAPDTLTLDGVEYSRNSVCELKSNLIIYRDSKGVPASQVYDLLSGKSQDEKEAGIKIMTTADGQELIILGFYGNEAAANGVGYVRDHARWATGDIREVTWSISPYHKNDPEAEAIFKILKKVDGYKSLGLGIFTTLSFSAKEPYVVLDVVKIGELPIVIFQDGQEHMQVVAVQTGADDLVRMLTNMTPKK
jgi:hypothetical protein